MSKAGQMHKDIYLSTFKNK